MEAFIGMWKKEWKMMRNFNIIFLIVILIFFGMSANSGDLVLDVVGALVFGMIIMPATILFSLNTDSNQLQHLLHTTKSIHQQIIVKVLHSMMLAVIFYFLATIAIHIVYFFHDYALTTTMDLLKHLWIFCLSGILFSLYPTAIAILLWSLHQWMKHYIGWVLSAVALFLIFYFSSIVFSIIKSLPIYSSLTGMGTITIQTNGEQGIPFLIGDRTTDGLLFVDIGFLIFYGFLCVVLYLLTVYILDRKVEV